MDITLEQLLVLLPLGAALALASRMILGIRTIGTFAPALLALNVIQLGVRESAAALLVATGAVFMSLPLIDRLALPRSSRLAVQVVIVITALVASGIVDNESSAVPVVVLTIALERTWDLLQTSGGVDALRVGGATVALSYAIAAGLSAWNDTLAAYPWYVMALIGLSANVAVGSYRGLRLTELMRFAGVRRAAVDPLAGTIPVATASGANA